MRMVRVLVVATLVIALAAGCGGGTKKTSAGDFVDATCVDLAAWATSIQKAFADLQEIGQFDASDPVSAQALLRKLSAALGEADSATSKLASGIESRGAPDIASGADIKKTLVDALNKLRDILSSTRTEVDNFDVKTASASDADKFKNDLNDLTPQIADAFAGLDPLDKNADLKSAFDNSAKCKEAGSALSESS
jgi:ABC-type transporter Mla subunit MlaD